MQHPEFLKVISDSTSVCSYLPQETSRTPFCVPTNAVSHERFDELMEAGYRRSGPFYYRTQCPNCKACEPLRLEVERFKPSRSQRRAATRGRDLQLGVGSPQVDQLRIDLFNSHRIQRDLAHGDPTPVDRVEYQSFLLNAPNESFELSLWDEDKLIAISITDVGRNCLSAVYCFFDPAYSHLSPGTLCILQQIHIARQLNLRWLYLGLFVAENAHLSYKQKFLPNQRLINDRWIDFD